MKKKVRAKLWLRDKLLRELLEAETLLRGHVVTPQSMVFVSHITGLRLLLVSPPTDILEIINGRSMLSLQKQEYDRRGRSHRR
jgi:hypothetical protein